MADVQANIVKSNANAIIIVPMIIIPAYGVFAIIVSGIVYSRIIYMFSPQTKPHRLTVYFLPVVIRKIELS